MLLVTRCSVPAFWYFPALPSSVAYVRVAERPETFPAAQPILASTYKRHFGRRKKRSGSPQLPLLRSAPRHAILHDAHVRHVTIQRYGRGRATQGKTSASADE